MTTIDRKSMTEKRAAEYGFSPAGDAGTNVAALQRALDGGGRIIIDVPGVYDLNDTIILDAHTHLLCSPGVIFRKVAHYCNMIINRGAMSKQYDHNITLEGLEISVNGFEAWPQRVYGLRAQLGFFYVKDFTLRNFTCVDGKENQYLIYFVNWSNLLVENVRLVGDKDGIKLNNGHDGLLQNLDLTTYDDGTSLCGTDYGSTLLEAGDVYNVTYRDVIDRQYKNIFGRTCLIYTGSWAPYANGNEYGAGDFCLHRGRLYQSLNAAGFLAAGKQPPTHESGVVTGDDQIVWRYVQTCDFLQTNVYDITFDNCVFEKSGNIIASFITPDWYYRKICGIHRNFYPGTERNSTSWGISLNNCKIAGRDPQVLINLMGNMKDVSIKGCDFRNPRSTLLNIDRDSVNPELNLSIRNTTFTSAFGNFPAAPLPDHQNCPILRQDIDDAGKLIVVHNASRVRCSASGNTYDGPGLPCAISSGGELQLDDVDLPLK